MKYKFFDVAKEVSKKSNHPHHQLGCCIVDKNKVISKAPNELKTHSKSIHPYKMLHAEISALLGLTYEQTKGCDAYIYRETKNGDVAMSKSCDSCHLALKKMGIRNVFYTTDNGWSMERVA